MDSALDASDYVTGEHDAFAGELSGAADIAFRLARSCGRDRDEAADILQEAALRAWKYRRSRRGEWRPWFLSIVYRLASRGRALPWLPMPRTFDAASSEWPGLHIPDSYLAIALSELPMRQRQALLLHYAEDLGIAEIAEVMSSSEAAAKQLLARARDRLRQRYYELDAREK